MILTGQLLTFTLVSIMHLALDYMVIKDAIAVHPEQGTEEGKGKATTNVIITFWPCLYLQEVGLSGRSWILKAYVHRWAQLGAAHASCILLCRPFFFCLFTSLHVFFASSFLREREIVEAFSAARSGLRRQSRG